MEAKGAAGGNGFECEAVDLVAPPLLDSDRCGATGLLLAAPPGGWDADPRTAPRAAEEPRSREEEADTSAFESSFRGLPLENAFSTTCSIGRRLAAFVPRPMNGRFLSTHAVMQRQEHLTRRYEPLEYRSYKSQAN